MRHRNGPSSALLAAREPTKCRRRLMTAVPWACVGLVIAWEEAFAISASCRSRIALRARIPPEADESIEWHPLLLKGRTPPRIKLPASFEALTSLQIYTAPRLDANLVPHRVVQKGTHFSVEEVVYQGRIRGQDVIFLKPKRVYYKASRNLPDDGEDYGQGGWLCDLGTDRGPWFCRKKVKRIRI
ncbi:unnamed protein product [Effrenium voratum]|nr:unnamed protein product [Effrenium voratum]